MKVSNWIWLDDVIVDMAVKECINEGDVHIDDIEEEVREEVDVVEDFINAADC